MCLPNVSLPWHVDSKNSVDSWVISFGSFTGGLLQIQSQEPVSTHVSWRMIPEGAKHRVLAIDSGTSLSLVYFVPKGLHLLPEPDIRLLRQLGFRIDAALQRSRNDCHIHGYCVLSSGDVHVDHDSSYMNSALVGD
eukprot:1607205-Amphidinium_carterae.1